MISKLGIWLDTNSALIVKRENENFEQKEVFAKKKHSFLNPIQSLGRFLHLSDNSENSTLSEPNNNYINAIFQHIEKHEELYLFGDAKLEKMLFTRIQNDLEIQPKRMEMYPVEQLSPNLRFRQIKAFLN